MAAFVLSPQVTSLSAFCMSQYYLLHSVRVLVFLLEYSETFPGPAGCSRGLVFTLLKDGGGRAGTSCAGQQSHATRPSAGMRSCIQDITLSSSVRLSEVRPTSGEPSACCSERLNASLPRFLDEITSRLLSVPPVSVLSSAADWDSHHMVTFKRCREEEKHKEEKESRFQPTGRLVAYTVTGLFLELESFCNMRH